MSYDTLLDFSAGQDEAYQIDAILQDFSKAFDKVSDQRLSIKLRHCDVTGNTLQ